MFCALLRLILARAAITIIITLEGIEEVNTEKMTTIHSKGLFTRPRAGHQPGSVHSGILRLHEPGLGQSRLTRVSFFFARLKGLVTTCQ